MSGCSSLMCCSNMTTRMVKAWSEELLREHICDSVVLSQLMSQFMQQEEWNCLGVGSRRFLGDCCLRIGRSGGEFAGAPAGTPGRCRGWCGWEMLRQVVHPCKVSQSPTLNHPPPRRLCRPPRSGLITPIFSTQSQVSSLRCL